MTNERQSQERELPNFEKYQYGALALRLFAGEEERFGLGALEVLAGNDGINLNPDGLALFDGAYKAYTEKGEKTTLLEATKNWAGKFNEARGAYKPLELASWYESALSGLDDEVKGDILKALGEHDETLADINRKYRKASKILSDSEDKDFKEMYTDEKRAEAKKIVEKYNGILSLMQTLDNYKLEGLRSKAVDATRKRDLEGLAKRL